MENQILPAQTMSLPREENQPRPLKKRARKEDPVQELIEVEHENHDLLEKIALNQEIEIEFRKSEVSLEKRKYWTGISGSALKYILWAAMIYFSFVFTQKLTEDLLGNMMGGLSGTSSPMHTSAPAQSTPTPKNTENPSGSEISQMMSNPEFQKMVEQQVQNLSGGGILNLLGGGK